MNTEAAAALRAEADDHAAAAERYTRVGANNLAARHERMANEKYDAADRGQHCTS